LQSYIVPQFAVITKGKSPVQFDEKGINH
jgi:hypothetical protein